MKKLLLTVLMLTCFFAAYPQKSADVGIRIGAAVYWGDVENVDYSKSITSLYGVLGRWNFNKRMSIRGQLIAGNLKAVGKFSDALLGVTADPQPKIDLSGGERFFFKQASNEYKFARMIQTVETIFEFNFMDYKIGSLTKNRFTPFLSLGIGIFYSSADVTGIAAQTAGINSTMILKLENPLVLDPSGMKLFRSTYNTESTALVPIIPMGFGIKYNLTKRLGACVELSIRKTFTDKIDNLDDPQRYRDPVLYGSFFKPYPEKFASTSLMNKDWYASLHLSLTWQVWEDRGVCKVNDKNVKKSAF